MLVCETKGGCKIYVERGPEGRYFYVKAAMELPLSLSGTFIRMMDAVNAVKAYKATE